MRAGCCCCCWLLLLCSHHLHRARVTGWHSAQLCWQRSSTHMHYMHACSSQMLLGMCERMPSSTLDLLNLLVLWQAQAFEPARRPDASGPHGHKLRMHYMQACIDLSCVPDLLTPRRAPGIPSCQVIPHDAGTASSAAVHAASQTACASCMHRPV